jgi:molybdopterin synthase sulfur carrier subunit
MKIKVLYFSSFREAAGVGNEILELDEGTSIDILIDQLNELHPKLSDRWNFAIFSVNKKYVESNQILHDGDELGIFPPISGG